MSILRYLIVSKASRDAANKKNREEQLLSNGLNQALVETLVEKLIFELELVGNEVKQITDEITTTIKIIKIDEHKVDTNYVVQFSVGQLNFNVKVLVAGGELFVNDLCVLSYYIDGMNCYQSIRTETLERAKI